MNLRIRQTVRAIVSITAVFGLYTVQANAQPRLASLPSLTQAAAAVNPGQDMSRPGMTIYENTKVPFGFIQFCQQYLNDCLARGNGDKAISLTPKRWNELVTINQSVNTTVRPVEDIALYKTIEYWTYPNGAGDCEDYVLLKRKMLVERGWPTDTLLITVVRDENNLGHAVLTVVTDDGDYILDNRSTTIQRWQEKPYLYRKRQSQDNPLVWVSLDPTEALRGGLSEQVSAK